MREVLMSIQPKWCELIASGKKTVEVRKTRPKCEVTFKVYIYETKVKKYEHTGICGYKTDGTQYNFIHHIGKVIGEFVCDEIKRIHCQSIEKEAIYAIAVGNGNKEYYDNSCMSYKEAYRYLRNVKKAYAWHISDLVIYDEPKELSDFGKYVPFFDGISTEELEAEGVSGLRIKRPPQSWCYVEGGAE